MRPIIPSPRQYAYRNRITVHAQDDVIGFFRRDSHRLIDIERCPISRDEVNRAWRSCANKNMCGTGITHCEVRPSRACFRR